jgi:hypothetical protein
MAESKTRHVGGFRRRGAQPRAWGERRPSGLRWAAAAALALLSAGCFSPEAYTEHLCRTCTSECPDGLTCYGQRCVPACDSSCVGDYECNTSGACVPKSGEETCPTSSLTLALCVGQQSDNDIAATMPSDGNADEPWVVLHSRLPEGVAFDPETGKLSGTPTRAEEGLLTVRHGAPGSEELSVDLVAIESCRSIETPLIRWCLGKEESHTLEASPAGQYEWALSSSSDLAGVTVQGDTLTGQLDELGTHDVRIELKESGRVVSAATLQIQVDDCGMSAPPDLVAPPLDITSLAALPNACEGAEYAADFEATGGQGSYRWTLETELAGLALDEATGTLTGTPLASGDFDLTVRVEDSGGSSDSITAVLHVVSATEECTTGPLEPTEEEACAAGTAATCPRAPLRIATTDLGVACVGEELSLRLQATGGGGDYRWSPSDPPPSGLTLERTGELHGVPEPDAVGKHQLSVVLSSTVLERPLTGTVKLEIASCEALVFLTDEPGSDRLFHTNPGSGVVNELSDGVLRAGEDVHSFALSADGAHLAFDVTSDNAPSRLYWVDLATFQARLPTFDPPLPESASVIDYRWSPDGSRLAATFRDADDEVFLGVSPAAGGPGSSIYLGGRYRFNLFWGGEHICYVAPGLEVPFASVVCHAMTSEGVDDQAPVTGIFPRSTFSEVLLLGNEEGYLAIRSDGLGARYFLPGEFESSADHIGRVFSPGFHRAAKASSDNASIFEVFTSRGTPSLPTRLAQLDPCDKLDAWSFDERSIACRSGDSLAIHRLEPNGALASGSVVEDSEGYLEEEFRRLLAPGGQWYAYDAGNELRVVSLDATPLRSRAISGGVQGLYAGLGTDPSGAHLYYHHGSDLEVVDTQANFAVRNVNGNVLLSDPSPCNEAQLDEGPRLWCGAQSTPSFFFPAPGAALVAFVDRQNQLYVADAETASAETSAPRLVHAASVKCTMDSGETACDNFVQWVPRPD